MTISRKVKNERKIKMKRNKIKMLAMLLTAVLLVVPFSFCTTAEEITPYYNNTVSTDTCMQIDDNGLLTIAYGYFGITSKTTHAVITTYVEKRFLGVFWSRVDIGTTDNQWVDTIYDYRYNGERNYQLSKSGTYRVKVTYTIYGSGGAADVVEYEGTDSY